MTHYGHRRLSVVVMGSVVMALLTGCASTVAPAPSMDVRGARERRPASEAQLLAALIADVRVAEAEIMDRTSIIRLLR